MLNQLKQYSITILLALKQFKTIIILIHFLLLDKQLQMLILSIHREGNLLVTECKVSNMIMAIIFIVTNTVVFKHNYNEISTYNKVIFFL